MLWCRRQPFLRFETDRDLAQRAGRDIDNPEVPATVAGERGDQRTGSGTGPRRGAEDPLRPPKLRALRRTRKERCGVFIGEPIQPPPTVAIARKTEGAIRQPPRL